MRRVINFLVNLGDAEPPRDCSLCFTVDLSGSMAGEPLAEVKRALARAASTLAPPGGRRRDEALLLTFDSDIREICPWVDRSEFDFFTDCIAAVPEAVLAGGGRTRFWDAVWAALERTRTGARADTEHLLVLFSDGGEYGSEDHNRKDVLAKLKQCRHGALPVGARDEMPLAGLPAGAVDALFETSADGFLVFRDDPLAPGWAASSNLPAEVNAALREEAARSRRPVRILSLHFGSGHEEVMRGLSEASGGEYLHAAHPEEIARLFERAMDLVLRSERCNLRERLIGRLSQSKLAPVDWFRVVSVNDDASEWSGATVTGTRHPNYRMSSIGRSSAPGLLEGDRRRAVAAFRAGPGKGLVEDLRRLLSEQAADRDLLNSGIQSQPLVLVSVRGRDLLGTAIAGELVDAVAEANRDGALFEGAANMLVVVLLDGWLQYSAAARHDLFALLLELANRPAETSPAGVVLLSEQNDAAQNPSGGFAGLDEVQFGNLALEALVTLNAEQTVAATLPTELALAGDEQPDSAALGVTSLFVDGERAARAAAAREIRAVLASLFAEPADVAEARRRLGVEELAGGLRASRLGERLLAGDSGGDLVARIDCPDIARLAFFEPAKSLRFVNRDRGGSPYREIVFRYRDRIDYLKKVFLDIQEYITVCHSLDFFAADLEANAEALGAELADTIRSEVDGRLCGDVVDTSPWHARELLRELRAWLDRYLEEDLDREFREWCEARYSERIEVVLGKGLAAEFDAARLPEYRQKLRELLANAPLPGALWTKYGSAVGLGAVVGGAALSAALPAVAGVAICAAAGMALIGAVRRWRSQRAIEDHLTLYHAASRLLSRERALALTRERLGALYDALAARIGAEDEPPGAEEVDPFAPESHSERQLLAVLERHVTANLPRAIPEQPPGEEAGNWFRVDVGNDEIVLPRVRVRGPLAGAAGAALPPAPDLLRRYLALRRDCSLNDFPSCEVRFVPDLKPAGTEARAKLRVEEIVREKRYRLTLLAPLVGTERKELDGLPGGAEWREAIARLDLLASRRRQRDGQRLFGLWREVVQYELWLSRLARLIERQEPKDKEFRLFDLWRRTYLARREFREGLFGEAFDAAKAWVEHRQRLFSLLGDGFGDGATLYGHVAGFSFPAARLAHDFTPLPRPWAGLFASEENRHLYGISNVLGGGPKAGGWSCEASATAGNDEARFATIAPIRVGFSAILSAIARDFLALDAAGQEAHLLDGAFREAWRARSDANGKRPGRPPGTAIHVPFVDR